LRARLAYDGRLLGAVSRIFVDSILGWYRRRMEIEGAARGQSGAVTVVQRVSADLKLNPHFHLVALDGVFVAGPAASQPVFHALPRISDVAVADLLQVIRARLLCYLVRCRVVEDDGEGQNRFLADDLAEREPALAQLAAAAVAGLPPAGPELRRKPLTVVLPASDGPKVVRPLCVEDGGFSLHAHTRAGAEDDVGRNNLRAATADRPRARHPDRRRAGRHPTEKAIPGWHGLRGNGPLVPGLPPRGLGPSPKVSLHSLWRPPFWQSRVLRRRYGGPHDPGQA
jgi:hypothetical protein